MKTEEIKVKCSDCNGTGQEYEWVELEGRPPKWVVKDCEICKGTGRINTIVVDLRNISKKRGLILPVKY